MRRRILTRLLLAAIVLGGCAAVWQALLAASPVGLGDTLAGFTYACDGDVYTLPTPVAEYLANGWELEQPPAPAMPAMEHIREWAAEFPVSETRMLESGEDGEGDEESLLVRKARRLILEYYSQGITLEEYVETI